MTSEEIEEEQRKHFRDAVLAIREANDFLSQIAENKVAKQKDIVKLLQLCREASCAVQQVERLMAGCEPPKKGD